MKTNRFLVSIAALIFGLSQYACDEGVISTLNDTPHPDQGQLLFNLDWDDNSDAAVSALDPTFYNALVSDQSALMFNLPDAVFPNLVDPGLYLIGTYNRVEGLTVDFPLVTVNGAGTGQIETMPDFLFGGYLADYQVNADAVHRITTTMKQEVGQITFTINAQGNIDGITSIVATLSGVAGSLDLIKGKYDQPTTMPLVFKKSGTGASATLTSTIRVLGFVPNVPINLSVTINQNAGSPIVDSQDLGTQLADFNTLKSTDRQFGTSAEIPADLNGKATITPWTVVDEGNIEVGEEVIPEYFAVGDYYPFGATAANAIGVVFWIDPDYIPEGETKSTRGKVIHKDVVATTTTYVWDLKANVVEDQILIGSSTSQTLLNGKENTAYIFDAIKDIPNWETRFTLFARVYEINGNNTAPWYVPSFGELANQLLFTDNESILDAINLKLADISGAGQIYTGTTASAYWTSTEKDAANAYTRRINSAGGTSKHNSAGKHHMFIRTFGY